ncbi:MAG: hypothetical protein IPG47_07335 [Thermoflexaceae bacterium]|nr:hypothetical protein [Thermoflexaceae bacterium]
MGHRKQRKRERRANQRDGWPAQGYALQDPGDDPVPFAPAFAPPDDLFNPWGERGSLLGRAPAKACGQCREFIEDRDGGRGSCLHPGSGIAFPWTDTPGCDFHAPRRR